MRKGCRKEEKRGGGAELTNVQQYDSTKMVWQLQQAQYGIAHQWRAPRAQFSREGGKDKALRDDSLEK